MGAAGWARQHRDRGVLGALYRQSRGQGLVHTAATAGPHRGLHEGEEGEGGVGSRGSRVQGAGSRVQRVQGPGSRVVNCGGRVQGSEGSG